MAAHLIVGVLNVRSSFRSGEEVPLANGEAPDTVQWCVSDDGTAWRLRSYAFDHDLHALLCGIAGDSDAPVVEMARELAAEMREQYGTMLKSVHTVELPAFEKKACAQALRRAGLKPSIEMAPSGFAFWNPDGQPYETELGVL
jgi:hypothetical protein